MVLRISVLLINLIGRRNSASLSYESGGQYSLLLFGEILSCRDIEPNGERE
jgi:hypothetical protein